MIVGVDLSVSLSVVPSAVSCVEVVFAATPPIVWLASKPGFEIEGRTIDPLPNSFRLFVCGPKPYAGIFGEGTKEKPRWFVWDYRKLTAESRASLFCIVPRNVFEIDAIPLSVKLLSIRRNAKWNFLDGSRHLSDRANNRSKEKNKDYR
ncbi:MAG: hypothetical protein ABL974_22780 [Prosthecobacter sp.]